jgi:hypothetical protein
VSRSTDRDLVWQYDWDTVRDLQLRVINASLVTNLTLESPVSRVLAQVIPPFQIRAHWAEPAVDLAGDQVRISTQIRGGVRHAPLGMNLTVDGRVHARSHAIVRRTDDDLPYASLAAPTPLELDLRDLQVRYEGNDEELPWTDRALEEAFLRTSLCTQLMAPLAHLPISYLPTAAGLIHVARSGSTTWMHSIDPDAETLTLTRCSEGADLHLSPTHQFLPDDASANAVVAISQDGLNEAFRQQYINGVAATPTSTACGTGSWRC